jgi:hypothetical protein
VVASVDSSTVIEIGDLVWQDVDDAKPASMLGNVPDAFVIQFLGVSMQRSRSGDDCPIRVASTGVFEFDCPGGTFELGDLVGPTVEQVPGTRLLNQQVAPVDEPEEAIARVARREPTATTNVLVDIRSTVMTGGV